MKNTLREGKLESEGGKAAGAGREGGGGPAAPARLLEVLWAIKCLGSPAVLEKGQLCRCLGVDIKQILMLLFHQDGVQERCFNLKLAAKKV